MGFHNHQNAITKCEIPLLLINNTVIEKVTQFNFNDEFLNGGGVTLLGNRQ